jgi:hypothetical protein
MAKSESEALLEEAQKNYDKAVREGRLTTLTSELFKLMKNKKVDDAICDLQVSVKSFSDAVDRYCGGEARSDGASFSKTFKYKDSDEFDLGKTGFGEVEFYVSVKVSIEASFDRFAGNNKWYVGDGYEDGITSPLPEAALKTAIDRYLASPKGREYILEQIGENF